MLREARRSFDQGRAPAPSRRSLDQSWRVRRPLEGLSELPKGQEGWPVPGCYYYAQNLLQPGEE